jgi:hypothetical protein
MSDRDTDRESVAVPKRNLGGIQTQEIVQSTGLVDLNHCVTGTISSPRPSKTRLTHTGLFFLAQPKKTFFS